MLSRESFKRLANQFVTNTFADFTKQFEIQSLVTTPDGQGGFDEQWLSFSNVTGFVSSLDGKESFKDERLSSDYMKKFKFEYIPGIENTMKIIFDGDNYNIRSIVSVQECDIWIEVIAEKDVAV